MGLILHCRRTGGPVPLPRNSHAQTLTPIFILPRRKMPWCKSGALFTRGFKACLTAAIKIIVEDRLSAYERTDIIRPRPRGLNRRTDRGFYEPLMKFLIDNVASA
jgi:hypothetical protein